MYRALQLTSHFTAEAKRLYKNSTHLLLPHLVVCYFSPLSFCFKKVPNLMYDLLLYIVIQARKGSQSLLKSYISPLLMYIKRLFSLPQWKCLFSYQSRLSVPELVTYREFFLSSFISASSFADVVLIRTQLSTLQWRLCLQKDVLYAITDL